MIKSGPGGLDTQKISFWGLYRLVFVLFSLYLLGDAFFRWDGFSYYASFADFLPGVALASIFWSITALFTTLTMWILFKVAGRLFYKLGLKINSEHLLFSVGFFIFSGALVWKIKKIIWPDVETTFAIKTMTFAFVALMSVSFSVLFRDRVAKWLNIIQERITPLVWLFGTLVFISFPLVGYHLFDADKISPDSSSFISSPDKNKPNILLVTFDALTARNMSLYGYQKNTTPFIKAWSENAKVFTNAVAASNFTTSSVASLMTGKRVWSHRAFQIEGTPLKSEMESLPAELKKNGYYNMAFIVNPHITVKQLGIDGSIDFAPKPSSLSKPASLVGGHFGHLEIFLSNLFGNKIAMHDWVLKNDFILGKLLAKISNDFDRTAVPPEKAFNGFLKTMEGNSREPFFAWIHVLPPHDPYLPAEPFKFNFNSSDKIRSFKAQEEIKTESYKYLIEHLRFTEEIQPDIDLLKDYYDEFIRYCDKQLEEFVKRLEEKNLLENTVVILSADHGESFEHGYLTHGGPFLYEQVTHIPLIIKDNGQAKGRIINDRVEQIDITATILDLAKIPVPSWMEGRSLVPLMRGESLPPRPAFSMNFEENRSLGHLITKGSIAVWDGDYKLIYYLERNESLLFDIKRDPSEIENLVDKEHETGSRLLTLIRDNLREANERIRYGG